MVTNPRASYGVPAGRVCHVVTSTPNGSVPDVAGDDDQIVDRGHGGDLPISKRGAPTKGFEGARVDACQTAARSS